MEELSQLFSIVDMLSTTLSCLQNEMNSIPAGYISTKMIKGRPYPYLQWRSKGKVISKYIKRDNLDLIKSDITRRKILKEQCGAISFILSQLKGPLSKISEFLAGYEGLPVPDPASPGSSPDCPFREEGKKHISADGVRVRSKSETVIAALLFSKGIKYRYEEPLKLKTPDGILKVHPDFTVYDKRKNQTIYWEHLGMINDDHYMDQWEKKRRLYRNNGIKEGKNLIITYDDEAGGLDTHLINNIISRYFCL